MPFILRQYVFKDKAFNLHVCLLWLLVLFDAHTMHTGCFIVMFWFQYCSKWKLKTFYVQVLFQNDSPATLLARVIGIIGPIDQDLLVKGRDTYKYFTKNHMLYERNQVNSLSSVWVGLRFSDLLYLVSSLTTHLQKINTFCFISSVIYQPAGSQA